MSTGLVRNTELCSFLIVMLFFQRGVHYVQVRGGKSQGMLSSYIIKRVSGGESVLGWGRGTVPKNPHPPPIPRLDTFQACYKDETLPSISYERGLNREGATKDTFFPSWLLGKYDYCLELLVLYFSQKIFV